MRERNVKSIDEILELSFKFLTEHGLENTSIRDLSKETGMSLGSIYYWFESKEDLIINAVKYGLFKSSATLFEQATDIILDLDTFSEKLLEIIKKEQPVLRMVYQLAASPVYGDLVRKHAEPLNRSYEDYIHSLSKTLNMPFDEIRPIIFLFIATILDYVIWDDYEFSKSQVEYVCGILKSKMNK